MLALAMMLATPAAQAQDLSIPYETYTLDNGLKVIFSEDHSVPVVQVNVWYHVGSKDEVEGRTGFAHLFEHLMFQGSENNDQDYFGNLQEVGARVNGTTNGDRTNYFEGVPSAYLPLALWGEADRMGFLVIDQERLDNQKEVVRNERRQRYENRPFGTSWVTLQDKLFRSATPTTTPPSALTRIWTRPHWTTFKASTTSGTCPTTRCWSWPVTLIRPQQRA